MYIQLTYLRIQNVNGIEVCVLKNVEEEYQDGQLGCMMMMIIIIITQTGLKYFPISLLLHTFCNEENTSLFFIF